MWSKDFEEVYPSSENRTSFRGCKSYLRLRNTKDEVEVS
jgi:hypothetical protein